MPIENRLALSLMAKMREIVNLGRMEEEVKLVFKCFFLFDLQCVLLRTGLLKHWWVCSLSQTYRARFVLGKACSHTFLFDSCNNTVRLISCHSSPQCSHRSLLAVLGPHQTPSCLGAFAYVIPLSWNILSSLYFPPSLLKYHSLRRCFWPPKWSYISHLYFLICTLCFFFMAIFRNIVAYYS